MSQQAERSVPDVSAGRTADEPSTASTADPDPLGVESGLEALRASPEFDGPVEPLEDLEANEHIALFYEDRAEQLSAVVPFVRQGIERGERVMYVVADDEEAAVREALLSSDPCFTEALDSGALTFHTVAETYLRTGRFDPDDMLDVYAEAMDAAAEEYPALRITADTTWILDEHTTIEDFMAYESRVNDLFRGEDCIALCQYDREATPAETLADVVRTHPHLIYDGTVCHNFYYTPPREYFEPDEPARDVDRMLGTLVERTQAKAERDETIEALEESNDRLQRFAYVASHDLQEPLRMISTYLQLLERKHADQLDPEAAEYVDFAVDGADRMREMVQGLLSYSRVDMHDGAFEAVDADAILENALTDLRLQIADADATVSVAAATDDGTLPTVHGDANQLEQVLSNLVSNAVKYGGDEPTVEVEADRRADDWLFSVADDGIGIDPAYADQIFEVFNRLHAVDDYPGTGIGLALCRKIVDHHGGDLWVDSRPGEGSTFYFTLPAAE